MTLHRLCGIAVLLLTNHAVASDFTVNRSGTFKCNERDNVYMSFENGRIEVGKDRPETFPLEIEYKWATKNDDGSGKPAYDRVFAEVTTNMAETISSYYMDSDTAVYAFELTEDKFAAVRRGFSIHLKRVYKEDWSGFMTRNFLVDEGSVFNSALVCKRVDIKG